MRAVTVPESGPKRSLLDAAERLFAAKGFEAVSVRDITQLAKANVAAVNYHFGSRDELLGLVMARYLGPVNEARLARLDAAERKAPAKTPPLEEIIDAFAGPLVGPAAHSGLSEPLFQPLLGRILARHGDGLPAEIDEQLRQVFERFTRSFAKALPGLAADDLVWRIHLMTGGLVHLLTHQEVLQRLSKGVAGAPSMEDKLGRFIRFAAAGLREGVEAGGPAKNGPQVMFDF